MESQSVTIPYLGDGIDDCGVRPDVGEGEVTFPKDVIGHRYDGDNCQQGSHDHVRHHPTLRVPRE